ncbi:Cytochrome p450 [Thalictrum thalictroides]|uniref:Cytochrome p450 n=1 Tax=Thalictrum thalictroides TaxID=46969 RepID=A0A7J6VCT9_THATH|nr:Cytochrome p450 [Thalictrum thalictroides]
MEITLAYTVWSGICLAIALLVIKYRVWNSSKNRPPGPPGWPIIGNLLDLGAAPHQSLAGLSRKYGPVLWLRLGLANMMVVSSAEAAMDLFKNHDLAFADRKIQETMKVHNIHQASMGFAPYGPYWRMLRRISTTELFTSNRINGTEDLRAKCIEKMTKWMWEENQEKGSVGVARFVALGIFNIIGNVTLTKDITVDPQLEAGTEFFVSLTRAMELNGLPNVSDFYPFLKFLDLQRIRKKVERAMVHPLNFSSGFVKERLLARAKGQINEKKDFLDVMLEFKGNQKDGEPAKISEENINILLLELFTAATDTSTITIEWAMTELLRNPHILKNVEDELDQVVGKNTKVTESDIWKLPYLQAVVKETLRLHPPVTLLLPRRCIEDTEYMGYSIPKDTQVFVNVWAIGRDPASWEEPLSFQPERFLNSNIDFKGQHYQLLPFGAGRRMCVALMLGQRMLYFSIASLVHTFEWALEDGVTPETMDMRDMFGSVLRKAEPLKAVLKLKVVQKDQDNLM